MVENICKFNNLLRSLATTFMMTAWFTVYVFTKNIESSNIVIEQSSKSHPVGIKKIPSPCDLVLQILLNRLFQLW